MRARKAPGAAMELIPAIDLLDGKVVRLEQGDFNKVTVYGDDPVAMARRWAAEGATRLHLVDLDGARSGQPAQGQLIAAIIAAVDIPCQVAGGLRTPAAVRSAIDAGADRVVLGTVLLGSAATAADSVAACGANRVVAALDVRNGHVVGSGWVPGAIGVALDDALERYRSLGIELVALTAIARDGLLQGPDLDLLGQVASAAPWARVIASAGVSSAEDVRRLAARGVAGVILGRALYDGRITIAAALDAARPGRGTPTSR